ncbi:alpha/beta hydrolase [Nocardia speluncae]|uniref:Alpha/beta hydrolase n=2 Tax=Nocardia TaxID=1817 RepID=A0A846XHW8_9NOCA|nr:alpha/beta hydrolase [Nocardia cyriacigeorgica]MBF6479404.1 alpha/beta hydrolase [Nocardia cyriacigeorgica]MBF6553141.1 alpha/beta hydrolase [Nocardia cyriacigeorgica]NKY34945.1 alpha/beta hydrolase [Nocardia speluncae]TLF77842.1 alpha/beta hydrolase [Nocardia cyriacigeorgica]
MGTGSEVLVRGGRVLSADGTPITYLVQGSGPVLLVVHGGLGSAVSMLSLAGYLAEHYTVVAMNCRGHGTSGTPQSAPDIAHEVADIVAVIDAVGPVEVVFGYSFGAVLALETALRASDRVSRLAVYEPPLPVMYPIPDLSAVDAGIEGGDYERLILDASAVSGGFSAAELAVLRSDPLWWHKVAQAPTLAATLRVLAGLDPDVGRYAAITAQTTVITGTTSADYILDAADRLTTALRNPIRKTLSGQGHHVALGGLAQALLSG